METVEHWMWTAGGIIIASLFLVGAYSLMAKYFHNSNLEHASSEFERLSLAVAVVCSSGLNTRQSSEISLPKGAESIYSTEDGGKLCLAFEKEQPLCSATAPCSVSADGINVGGKGSLLDYMPSRHSASFVLDIKKPEARKVEVTGRRVIP
ncbi:MAG: hypothetical protein HY544_05505 [Candidatus Diapherotrites archaeon]|uniref:Uncharacterized protein n=1 Tax=Candidatus Iainarchaeum sp. TaxID=3101447 RepID=A0A8T3YMI8_9ARCH|nr:hypothetical protein [Candidatus Diapherotrites archaeon]